VNSISAWEFVSENGTAAAREAVDQHVTNGAIMLQSALSLPSLVAALRWVDDFSAVWFPAFGDKPTDAVLLCYDSLRIGSRGAVDFLEEGAVVGSVNTWEVADVDIREDYRIAWQLWLQVAPLHASFISRCFRNIIRANRRRV
jgi:hypothetical protein